jgi:hypothetical protein
MADPFPLEGGCTCRFVRYRLEGAPILVHCCHCRWCQRESGAAFALNAVIERDRVTHLTGELDEVLTPSESGRGQRILRCPRCRVAVWSHYPGGGNAIRFVRVGTLDQPDVLPPSVHIYTASKQPWVVLPADTPSVPAFYDPSSFWTPEQAVRFRAAKERHPG